MGGTRERGASGRRRARRRRSLGSAPVRLGLAGVVAGALAVGCHTRGINSDLLLQAFNGGATDSIPDPALSAVDIARERVIQKAKSSLIRGYATQGTSDGPSVAAWLRDDHVTLLAWKQVHVRQAACPVVPPTSAPASPSPSPSPSPSSSSSPSPSPSSSSSSPSSSPSSPSPPPSPAGAAPPSSPPARSPAQDGLADDECGKAFRAKLYDYLLESAPSSLRVPDGPVCSGTEATRIAHLRSDAARLGAALDLAASEIAAMIGQERVVTEAQAEKGLKTAMREAADYLAARRWRPSDRVPTFGLSIKGGASTGVYSAGVVWRVLTLLQRYQAWKAQRGAAKGGISPLEARLSVTSGTSAGAIIAAVTDIFHEEQCEMDCDLDPSPDRCSKPECKATVACDPHAPTKDRPLSGATTRGRGEVCEEYARRLTASLFTCPSQAQLYCVDSRPVWNLLGKQQGLMDFDGLRRYIAAYVKPDAVVDPTELVLTTVDFRWGQLYAQSDQDPSTVDLTDPRRGVLDVHKNIQASFVLPFIAWPVESLRVRGAQRAGIFLDGGIQSEIPIDVLIQRGVERAIVVGSAPPEATPTAPQKSALEIAARYLDVSLSGVTGTEWRNAVPHARYVEATEYAECKRLFEEHPATTPPGFDLDAFCTGRLAESCGGEPYAPIDALPTSVPTRIADTIRRQERGRRFDLVGVFRDERVAPTFGYSFDPVQMKRLFSTGIADARGRCIELAYFLGMSDATSELDRWCNETPRFEPLLCPTSPSEQKTCSEPPEEARR
jgi:predicted acylesterase/phospholipase RssA